VPSGNGDWQHGVLDGDGRAREPPHEIAAARCVDARAALTCALGVARVVGPVRAAMECETSRMERWPRTLALRTPRRLAPRVQSGSVVAAPTHDAALEGTHSMTHSKTVSTLLAAALAGALAATAAASPTVPAPVTMDDGKAAPPVVAPKATDKAAPPAAAPKEPKPVDKKDAEKKDAEKPKDKSACGGPNGCGAKK